MALTVGAVIYPQISSAEGFTGEDFAAWPTVSQDSYIQSSVMMAGVIGAQVKPEISRCIDSWYFVDEDTKATRNDSIREVIAGYGTYHPSGVILALIQQECGAFD